MADYKAGNLTLEFFGIDRSTEKTITNVVNKLNLLQRSLNVFQKVNATAVGKNLSASFYNIGRALGSINENDINKLSSLAKATNYLQRFLTVVQKSDSRQVYGKLNSLFRALSSSVNSIDQTTLSNITAVSSALSSLGRFSTKMTKLDFAKTETGFKNLAVAIQPFLEKVKEAEAGLSSLYGILQKSSGKKIQGLLGGGNRNQNGGLFGFARFGLNLYMMRRMGRFMANLVQAGSDYNETLNLWQVAMRGNLDMADEFVNKVQKAYGISTQTIMEGQAVYKNMLGSLGQISDETATKISESLVLMTADYASLYNRSIKSAFQNMQSMLAGQVRPIRSAGLDITETTLYQYYQQIGGTKAMRQLTRTEKQLLSILAVYEQMGKAGALGDMGKTLNEYANQSRILVENFRELKTWSGLIIKDIIQDSNILTRINAYLITITEIVKALGKKRGIEEGNYLTGLFETTEETNDAVDELQGKLLDFDKFRSLEGVSISPISIDKKLLDALSNYSSVLENIKSESQDLAETWLEDYIDKQGNLTEKAKSTISFIVSGFGLLTTILIASKLSADGVAFSIARVSAQVFLLIAGFSLLVIGFQSFVNSWKDRTVFENVLLLIGAITAALIGAFVAFRALGTTIPVAIALGAALSGAILALTSNLKSKTEIPVTFAAVGASDLDGGTLFVAGEMGKTEAVYQGANGKTNVANVRQMEQAFYNALSRHSREGNGTIVVQAVLDGEVVYENTTSRARARGQIWAKA